MSVIQAGNTTTTSLIYTGDTTGNLVFTTGGANTVALTLANTQAATFAGSVAVTGSLTIANGTALTNASTGSVIAMVQFSAGSGTVVINNSLNVTSVTRASAGVYTVNFTSSVGSNPYIVVTGGGVAATYDAYATLSATSPTSTSAIILGLQTGTNTQKDLGCCTLIAHKI